MNAQSTAALFGSHSRYVGLCLLLSSMCLVPGSAASAQALPACAPAVAEIVSLQGTVEVQRAPAQAWQRAALGDSLCVGDAVRTASFSRAALALVDESVIRLDQETTLRLREAGEAAPTLVDLLLGAIYFFSQRPRALEVDTPFVNAGAEGTEFLVRVDDRRAIVLMFEGVVRVSNPLGELRLSAGEAAVAARDQAPRPEIVIRPRDAVAWAIYYPPILAEVAGGAAPPDLPRGLALAAEQAAANDYAGALQALEAVSEADRDAHYYTFRAGVLLNVGRVDEAQAAIDRALALAPEAGDALAQRATIALARTDRSQALEDARRAVELSPDAAPARIALSYALQAHFQLEEARDVLREAVERTPDDPLAWARLAEIELSLGNLSHAQEAAERAAALAPDLARTQIVLGFAALTRIDIDAARTAFERAIALDSANPLARLGLGLALIRRSDLAEGRRQIEIAANLDPTDALIRSYLGKVYFEETRDGDAAEQLAIAKQLDPNDPTPWFYDAIRKQTQNRPVEALRDLETSIRLNDNRAVYRSRLLLDQDLATRSVSLARIYDDLGFDQVALVEASRSLSQDPSNWSAHRFLSDAYARLPRHEIARTSELLQAQLLQPININPVQPSLPVTDLSIIRGIGPAEGAFNEFHPLFERNRAQLTATGVVGDGDGNENTFGEEVVVSGLWNRYSLSAGQLHFQTDGFRPNNDYEADLYNLFWQAAVSPGLSVQAEYRYRDTQQGDLELLFDPNEFFLTDRIDIKSDIFRAGGHLAARPDFRVLFHAGYVEREERLSANDPLDFVGEAIDDSSGYQLEGQILHTGERSSLVAGGGFYNVDVTLSFQGDFLEDGLPPEVSFPRQQVSIYAYDTISIAKDLDVILGASFDRFEQGRYEVDQINPKMGLTWQATPTLRLRAAYFETVKRALPVDQTLEPTQVAGFNQFFDDDNGSPTRSFGLGLDQRLGPDAYAGLEVVQREIERPLIDPGTTQATRIEDLKERRYRGYVYWVPAPRWAVSTALVYETLKRESQGQGFEPEGLYTVSLPVDVRYFSPSGFFAQLVTVFTYQNVERVDDQEIPDPTFGSDTFVVVDAAVGYRLPGRRGIASLEGRNLLDEDFHFQDDNFRTSEIRASPWRPARTVVARLTLNF